MSVVKPREDLLFVVMGCSSFNLRIQPHVKLEVCICWLPPVQTSYLDGVCLNLNQRPMLKVVSLQNDLLKHSANSVHCSVEHKKKP